MLPASATAGSQGIWGSVSKCCINYDSNGNNKRKHADSTYYVPGNLITISSFNSHSIILHTERMRSCGKFC